MRQDRDEHLAGKSPYRPGIATEGKARLVLENVAVLLAYWGLSHLDWLVFNRLSILPMPFWPAAGLALVAAVMRAWRIAPGIALGAILANRWSLSASWAYASCIGLTNTLGPLAAAAIIRKRIAGRPWLQWQGKDYTAVFIAGVVLAPVITATGGIGAKWILGIIPFASVARDFARWWLGHAIGTLLCAPLVLFFPDRREPSSEGRGDEIARYAQRATLMLAAFFWFVASIFDFFYFRAGKESFWSTLLALGHHHALVNRLFFVSVIAVSGFMLSRLLSQLAASESRERAAAEDLRTTLNSIGDAVIATDTRGVVTNMNPVAARLTGWAQDESVGHSLAEVFHIVNEATREKCEDPVAAVLRTGRAADPANHTVLVSRDGKKRVIADSAAPIQGKLGKSTGVVLVFRDITERRAAEIALLENQRFLADLVENSGALVFVKNRELRYQLVNRAWEKACGRSREDVLGKTDEELFAPADAQRFRANDLEAMTSEHAVEREEILLGGEGTRSFISIKFPLRDSAGHVTGICGMSTEITERKRAAAEREKLQSQLTQAQRMESVGRLAGGVAHDFNNMLQSIVGNAELALLDLPVDNPVRESLEEIRQSAQRSVDLTRQLLAFARRQTISPRALDLNETVRGMLKMLHRLIGEDIDLRWSPGPGIWPVRMDPSQVDQILANLCVNARDAIIGSGKVAIQTSNVTLDGAVLPGQPDLVPGNYVMLAVSDTGRGMDPETCAQVFEPFFTTKELGKGTGLGLATVFGIVKQNAGLIDVLSEPGRGTTFKLYFPRVDAEPVTETARPSVDPLDGTETVLLVEDEEQILDLGRRTLAQCGYTVLTALAPKLALLAAEQHRGPIHLLITDVVMPDMHGRELRDHLQIRYPAMRCLFMSGYTADVIAHHGVLDEGLDFLQKPFSLQTLKQKVREVLARDV